MTKYYQTFFKNIFGLKFDLYPRELLLETFSGNPSGRLRDDHLNLGLLKHRIVNLHSMFYLIQCFLCFFYVIF